VELSIGITCFNAQENIVRALASVTYLDDVDYEVIVVDDCSTDNSVTVISEYVSQLVSSSDREKFRLVCLEKNVGVAGARNEIINAAKGKYLAFLDDDDEWLPERFKLQRDKLIEHKSVGQSLLCYGARKKVYMKGEAELIPPVGCTGSVSSPVIENFFLEGYKQGHEGFGAAGTGTLLTELSTLKSLNGLDTEFRRCEDLDLVIRHCLSGGICVGVPAAVITQYETFSPDKGFKKEMQYRFQLIEKHSKQLVESIFVAKLMVKKSISFKSGARLSYLFYYAGLLLASRNFRASKLAQWFR